MISPALIVAKCNFGIYLGRAGSKVGGMKTKTNQIMRKAFRAKMREAAMSWRAELDKKYWLGLAVHYRVLSKQ